LRLYEIENQQYYHGSYDELPVGTILTPRDDYEDKWHSADFYGPLEMYRPANMLPHKASVFMCDNADDVDLAGGATDWLFTVVPIGNVEKHDLNWGSEVSMLMSDGHEIDSEEIMQASENYWKGIPHPNESVWEYCAPKAKIVAVEEY
jgi:hypothetical protein